MQRERLRAVVSAGGTSEPIDDVRVVTNVSTGRFGAAIANALVQRGVEVTLLGSASLLASRVAVDPRVTSRRFLSFDDLRRGLEEVCVGQPDLVFMAAAVSDYAPVRAAGKLPSRGETLTVSFTKTPKLLDALRGWCGPRAALVGFKLLSGVSRARLVEVARGQLSRADLDLCVANDLAELGGDVHPVTLVSPGADPVRVEGSRVRVAEGVVSRALELVGTCWPDGSRGARGAGSTVALEGALGESRWVRVEHPVSRVDAEVPVPPPAGSVDEAVAVREALCEAAQRGVWKGGPCVVRVGEGLLAGGVEATREDVLDRGRVVGRLEQGEGAPRLRLSPVSEDVLDGLAEALDRWGRVVVVEGEFARAPWVARGFAVEGERLVPPSVREGARVGASVCVLAPVTGQVLIGRRRTAPFPGVWAFPGGKPEGAEGLWEAAVRELEEETGVRLEGVRPWRSEELAAGTEEAWYRLTCFVVRVVCTTAPVVTDELEAGWMSVEEALALEPLAAGTRRVLRRLQEWS